MTTQPPAETPPQPAQPIAITRSQDEIAARFADSTGMFGFDREVLVLFLDFEHVRQHLKPDVTADQWAEDMETRTLDEVARDYLAFAIGKASDHRGISAERSVVKLREMAWLAGRDDVVTAMDAAEHENYGAPKLKAFAEGLALTEVWAEHAGQDVERMASGDTCGAYDCSGCGR